MLWIEKLNKKIGELTAWLPLVLVILIVVDVLLRYLFTFSSAAFFELEWHIFAALFLMGAGYTLQANQHVRVDVFYQNYSEKGKAWVNFLGSLLLLFPLCVVILLESIPFVISSFQMKETSPDAGGLPARFLIKSLIPIGFFFLFLQAISELWKSLKILRK